MKEKKSWWYQDHISPLNSMNALMIYMNYTNENKIFFFHWIPHLSPTHLLYSKYNGIYITTITNKPTLHCHVCMYQCWINEWNLFLRCQNRNQNSFILMIYYYYSNEKKEFNHHHHHHQDCYNHQHHWNGHYHHQIKFQMWMKKKCKKKSFTRCISMNEWKCTVCLFICVGADNNAMMILEKVKIVISYYFFL